MDVARLFSHLRLGALAALVASGLTGCAAVNTIPTLEERAKSAWSEVQNQYQRRADLIPNLVETVKGFAQQEREVLTQVTEARAGRPRFRWTPRRSPIRRSSRNSRTRRTSCPARSARLLVTVERYPDLKSNANFLALQSQLEGTENRIAVARRDYIETVRAYNTELRTIPGRWIAAVLYPDAPHGDLHGHRRIGAAAAGELLSAI